MKNVLIIGAGPAGLSAARELARGGARVTVVERHLRPGGKACGGGITREAWDLAEIVPDQLAARVFDEFRVRSPIGECRIAEDGPLLAIVDRQEWVASLVDAAREAGCEVRLGERVVGLESGRAATDQGEVRFDTLVGADGARSRVRRWLGLTTGSTVRALQLVMPSADPSLRRIGADTPVVWFDPSRFGPGYGWLFPADDEVRIGCGVSSASPAARGLKGRFVDWLGSLEIDPARGVTQAGTIGCGYMGHRFGNVFLAGDAAGLASPLTGEGIAQALVSGREVAREILEPGHRSPIVAELAARHRRTLGVLSLPGVGDVLYRFAPWLLRINALQREAIQRYC